MLNQAGAGMEARVPMTTTRLEQPQSSGWHRLGTPGGFVRPATGYCSRNWTVRTGASDPVKGTQRFGSTNRSQALDWLDRVLLGYLNRSPAEAPEIFYSMFERVHPDALVVF